MGARGLTPLGHRTPLSQRPEFQPRLFQEWTLILRNNIASVCLHKKQPDCEIFLVRLNLTLQYFSALG